MSLSRHVLRIWRAVTTGLGVFVLIWLISSEVLADKPKRCELWSEVPTCDATYYDDPEKRYNRNIFVNWIFQLAAYGNAPGRKEIEAMTESLDWLNSNTDPLGKMLWCTFDSLSKENAHPPYEIYAGYVPDTGKSAAYQARFWLSYDLSRNAVQDILTLIQSDAEASGSIDPNPKNKERFELHLTDATCTYKSLMTASYRALEALELSDSQMRLMGDTLDAAVALAAAIEGEITGADIEKDDLKMRTLTKQVNDQLHCEVLDPTVLDDKGCDSGGQIHERILVDVKDLSAAFGEQQREIESAAKTINKLNADLMAVDRNLRTYTEVFADFKKGSLDEEFNERLENLKSILAERELMGSDVERVWKPLGDGLELNEKNAIAIACKPSKTSEDCSYCDIKEPLGPKTLEQYLICFHVVGLKQAKDIRESPIISGTVTPADVRSTIGKCYSKRERELGGAEVVDAKKRDEVVAGCFLEWMWEIDPITAAQMEIAFLGRGSDE